MKKQLTALLTTALLLASLTGCTDENNSTADNSSVADTSSSVSSNSSSESVNSTESTNSTESETSSDAPKEAVRVRYGEAEIPDIPCGDVTFEGKVNNSRKPSIQGSALESMVFETHTTGDYTISLIGDNVRTDIANFPDYIYTTNLRAEVKKNGVTIYGIGGYCDTVTYVNQFHTEFVLLKDKVGSYLDLYEMERPVIAMRYFFPDDGREVKTAVEFAMIHNDELMNGFLSTAALKTGVILASDPILDETATLLALNSTDGERCRLSTFAADEFSIVDSRTLEDKTAGIRYTFNFTDPPEMVLYSTTLI